MEVGTELFSLCTEVIAGTSTVSDAVENLKKKQEEDKELASHLIDILIVAEGEAKEPEEKERFLDFVKKISDIIPTDLILMDMECLEANSEIHKRSVVRLKTRLYFKQSKFNIMREESEGYAKLITELLDIGNTTPDAMKTRVFCLIGQFNLDPNRVIDVVLQCLECLPRQKAFFVDLLKEMKVNSDYLLTLAGFQYSFYQAEGRKTPFSLYAMTAALIQAELLDLVKVTGYLKPNAEGIKEGHKARAANAATRAKKAETIVTTQIAVESSRGRDMDRDGGDGQPVVGVSFATVASIQDGEDEKLVGELSEDSVLAKNQKLGVVCALLEEGEWAHAQYLIDRLPEFYAVQASPRICRALAVLIDVALNDFYREKCANRLINGLVKKPEEIEAAKVEQIPKVTSYESFIEDLSPILWYLGPRIGYRPATVTKLVRLFTVFFQERVKDPSFSDDKTANALMDIVDGVLLPSLSLLVNCPNVALSEELWHLLQLFPYQHRYRLYGRWKNYHSVRHPELSIVRGKVLGRTKYVLKRLSKETVKVMGRQLGKLCHVHPMTVLEYMLSMVQTFDNFIGPVVESLRFLTSLEFDILSFCLMEQLASPDRQQLKQSDGNLSPWLQALGTMVGAIYKKYNVELAGILYYVANQLKNEKGFDLLILREIIQNMSSVESSVTATEEQLEALQGGEVLRLEAGGFSNARNKRASTRLRDALLDENLAVGLCILIAQQREFIIHHESLRLPLKLVGEMVDQCRDTLTQFGTFLIQNFKADEYAKKIPSAADLMELYGVPIDSAMFLTRPFFLPNIIAAYDESKKLSKALETEGKSKLDPKQKFVFFKSAMDEVVKKMITDFEGVKIMSTKALNQVSRTLLVTFWMLSSYDIEVPVAAYDRAVESTKKQAREIADSLEMSKSKRHKEIERLTLLETRLREEQRRQTEHVERVRMWLAAAHESLFSAKGGASVPFLATCVMKRAVFSEFDAIFCAKFAFLLTAQKTTYFQTIVFFDKIFSDLLPTISGLTENEASAFGRFLDCLMTKLNKWNFDQEAYEKECQGLPGFVLKTSKTGSYGPMDHLTFKSITFKWQCRCANAFASVLSQEDAEYVMIRNCLVVMAKMSNSFPVMKENHKNIEEILTKLREREKGKRDDLALKALSYGARMRTTADKMVDKAVYSPKSAVPKKTLAPPPKTNGTDSPNATASAAGGERKRPITNASTPDAKKKVRPEKSAEKNGEKKDANENGEKNSEETPPEEAEQEQMEEGEVTPDPPAKKARITTLTTNGKGREKEKERKKEDKKTEESSNKKTDGERMKTRKEEIRGEEKKESSREEKKTEERRVDRKEKKEERTTEKERKEGEKDRERRENEREKKEERNDREKKEERPTRRREEAKEDRRKKEAAVDVAGPALPPGMKEKSSSSDKDKHRATISSRREKSEDKKPAEREERRSVLDRLDVDRKRGSREVSKDEPSPKISRALSSGKMASDRMDTKSHRHHDDRPSSPPYRRQTSKDSSSRARR